MNVASSLKMFTYGMKNADIQLSRNSEEMSCICCSVQAQSDQRRKGLETIRQYFQFLQDAEEENAWVIERLDSVHSTFVGNDLNAALGLLKKHDVSSVNCVSFTGILFTCHILCCN